MSIALPSRRRVEPFFDNWILSRRPFWVARVEFAPFARQPGNLKIPFSVRFGAVWCTRVRPGSDGISLQLLEIRFYFV